MKFQIFSENIFLTSSLWNIQMSELMMSSGVTILLHISWDHRIWQKSHISAMRMCRGLHLYPPKINAEIHVLILDIMLIQGYAIKTLYSGKKGMKIFWNYFMYNSSMTNCAGDDLFTKRHSFEFFIRTVSITMFSEKIWNLQSVSQLPYWLTPIFIIFAPICGVRILDSFFSWILC